MMFRQKSLKRRLYELQKKIFRWIFKFPFIRWIIAYLIAGLILFSYYTSTVKFNGANNIRKIKGKPAIFACWHGRILIIPIVVKKYKLKGNIIASRDRDGRLMALIQKPFGIKGIYGSTGRSGAVDALRKGLRVLQNGEMLGLSPDGPRGPHMHIHDGMLYFAKMSGAPIIPVSATCKHAWFQKNRWDKFMLIPPFSRIIIDAGEPFYIGKKECIEDARTRLEIIMREQMWGIDSEFGLPKQPAGEKKGDRKTK